MIESLIKNLNQDIALLQLRIERDKAAGFYDMARLLEAMSMQLFQALGIADLKSKNQIQVNFPAIDSADDHKDGGIALQVTSVADAKKIKKTIETFEKKNSAGQSLKDGYATLYIFGFCRAASATKVPSYCKVIDPSFFVNKLIDFDDEEKVQLVLDSVRRHVDYSSLHPYSDIECLKIILGYVGRNAVRHYMSCEGNVHDMTKGLKEISELIGKGSVNGRQKSKAHHEFSDPEIGKFLLHALNEIGGITAIIHKATRGDGFVYLNQQEMQAIDARKRSITEAAQRIAESYGIDMPLSMHEYD
ncbi:SMEK domain-containing protein [Pseudoduganella aquatica]|uniref:SMEK domain-containing protein n=1 Tax=Pseudoduganella aquatica TaxID=2660641 RepID=A0A7X4HHG3_9BURK|nr:SMEK domain-containing protein [Pseudoduganella aquatica]MYN11235.1 SMEK domain-containing protein [Pseudoduganella aquatica]